MAIKEQIMNDMKTAMKEKNQLKLDSIRFLQAAIKNREIEVRPETITEEEIMSVIKKMVKQRKESIEQYKAANRQDLVDKEASELVIIEAYLPAQMSKEDVEKIVTQVIAEVKATSIKDMGAVMKGVVAKTAGTADNKLVSELIRAKLG